MGGPGPRSPATADILRHDQASNKQTGARFHPNYGCQTDKRRPFSDT
jgi:hypothetical protein